MAASDQRVENLIYWKKAFDNRWIPLNLSRAHVRTLDVTGETSLWREQVQLTAGVNWTEARDATDDRNTGGKYLTFRAPHSQRADQPAPLGSGTGLTAAVDRGTARAGNEFEMAARVPRDGRAAFGRAEVAAVAD